MLVVKPVQTVEDTPVGSEIQSVLALAYLCTDRLEEAHAAIAHALRHAYPPNRHYVLLLYGLISMRQRQPAEAAILLQRAIDGVDAQLREDKKNLQAWDIKGLALAGLAVCRNDSTLISGAKEAYREARRCNCEEGTLNRVRRLFVALLAVQGFNDALLAEVQQIMNEATLR
jgi:tetratricopeptide (TPR) repeat protein